jgi:hypothetical protein
MREPTHTQILAALENSGYLFEQQVADRLEAQDFHVETSWAFLDADQEKSRELDVRGIKRVFHDETNKLSVFVELLVECKAFENPMVFLQRPKNAREINHAAPREYVFPIKHYRKQISANSYQEVPPFIHLDLRHHHYYYSEPLKATQFSKIVRKGNDWSANHEGIYDALLLPLAKALECQRREVLKFATGPDWKYVWLLFPIVVLRDGLFTLDVSAAKRELQPKGRVSFVRHLESGNVKGFYLTDFVTFAHLDDFIQNEVQPFVAHIDKLCADEPIQLLRADA